MGTTPNQTQRDHDLHTQAAGPSGTGAAAPSGTRWPLRVGAALALSVAIIAGLFVAISDGFGSTRTTTITDASARGEAAQGQGGAVSVAVTAPTSDSVIAADKVTVRGTVSPANAVVQVQGHTAAVGNGVFTGTASLHGGKTTIDVIASAPGRAPGSTRIVVARQPNAHATRSSNPVAVIVSPQAVPNSGGTGQSSCGDALSVGPNTSCAFAENVRAAYASSGPGDVSAYSPVTNETYVMNCSDGSYVVCTGADDASVYFPSGSAGAAYQQPRSYGQSAPYTAGALPGESCGEGLAVGAHTSCSFAENVRSAYEESGPGDVIAYSPVTNRTYTMSCADSSPVVCTGGKNATVYIG
ncbi:MAG TPA: hypothetical protein VMB05_18080 [Solirubrobacteraceae bacterium]|nr:hypothetical protein [Solirubrobacteraceae bacterium]